MKKIIFIIFVFVGSFSYGQTIRSLIGLHPINSMPGYIYRDTAIELPYTVLKYLTGYGTFGSLNDSIRAAISLTTTGTSGAATYNSVTGVFNIPQYAGGGGSGWNLTGNAATSPGTNFIGTTDAQNFQTRTNSLLRQWVTSDGITFIDSFPIWRGASKGYNLSSVAIGDSTLIRNTTGINNTVIGDSAMQKNTAGSFNTAIGYTALQNSTTGNYNTAIGNQAMALGTNTGSYNTALNHQALYRNTSGSHNFAVGYQALEDNTTGSNNVAIGQTTLSNATIYTDNIGIGQSVMNSASFAGYYNIGIGLSALTANTSGLGNIALGFAPAAANTTGNYNTYIGSNTLNYNQTGSFNVALGHYAGRNRLGGANGGNATSSIFIGDSSRMNNINQIHQIVIGFNVSGLGSYTTVLGDSSTLQTKIYGITALSKGTDVASAAAIVLTGNIVHVTGTTTITSITATNVNAGATIIIIFDGALTFTNGNNLKIGSDFVTTADDTISLAFDGTNFYQVSRSVN